MRFLTEDMDSFMKEREAYEVKVNRLSPDDAHDMEDDMIEQIGEIIGTVLAWVIAIASVAIGGALGLGIGHVILVYFSVL